MSSAPPAKFFVNQGLVSSRTDMQNLLRPLLKQTVSYRYHRGRELIAHGTGWVERIVVDDPETSTYFTPISITLNIDSFEHLEFDTRPDQLLVYTLVALDERVDEQLVGAGLELEMLEGIDVQRDRQRREVRRGVRRVATSTPLRNRPVVTLVFPMSTASSMAG